MWGKTQMIYLDNAATTSMDKKTSEILVEYSTEKFFNPSASYRYALKNHEVIDDCKEQIKSVIGADLKDKVVLCSCATEANNMIIRSYANKQSKQMIFSVGEHPSVYNVAKNLLENGYDVKFIGLQKNGEVDYDELKSLLQNPTSFVSIMAVNNETGAINDLQKIRDLIDQNQPNAILHSDIVQAFGKIPVDFDILDAATISAHKIHGPKGLGAICVKPKVKLKPLMFGGDQEDGLRSGTYNIASIAAFNHVCKNLDYELEKIKALKQAFIDELKDVSLEINGEGSPYVLSLSFEGIRGETLMNMCQENDVIIGMGSACSSKKVGNRVLEAMKQKNIIGSIRVSFSKYMTLDEVKTAGEIVNNNAKKLYETLR